jgi:lysophospholipase L1-like esterase
MIKIWQNRIISLQFFLLRFGEMLILTIALVLRSAHMKSLVCRLKLMFVLSFLVVAAAYAQPKSVARKVPAKTPVGFESEINAFLRQDSASFPPCGAVLFTGSSTIRLWNNLADDFRGSVVINRGFGGSTMKALNYYLDYIVLPYKPAVIVVYEGDNDLQSGTRPGEFVTQCDTFIRRVHAAMPGTKICFLAVKPSFARKQQLPAQDSANLMLKKLVKKRPGTRFIDIRPLMYDRQGHLRKDYFESDSLHINAACYRAWAGLIRKKMYSVSFGPSW